MYYSDLKNLVGSESVIRTHRWLDDGCQRSRTRVWGWYHLWSLTWYLTKQVADHLVHSEAVYIQVPWNSSNPCKKGLKDCLKTKTTLQYRTYANSENCMNGLTKLKWVLWEFSLTVKYVYLSSSNQNKIYKPHKPTSVYLFQDKRTSKQTKTLTKFSPNRGLCLGQCPWP